MDWLRIHRTNPPLETVRTGQMEIELLASHDGTEVIRHVMQPKALFGLRPEDGWEALEFLLVLEGTLKWRRSEGLTELKQGDYVAAMPVREQCTFEAVEPTVMLYVCSRPVFHHLSREIAQMMEMTVAVEMKDGYTHDHCTRISHLASAVGRRMKLSPARLHILQYGAFFHDIGKVSIPDNLLGKPGALTPEEWEIMKTHTTAGRKILEKTFMRDAGPVVEQHHERLDGSGYPLGLKGDEILLESQIVAVVDSFDAMTTHRVYSKARTEEEALVELWRGAGTLYREDVIETFTQWIEAGKGLL